MSNEYEATIRELQQTIMRYEEQNEVWMKSAEKFSNQEFLARMSANRYKKIIDEMYKLAQQSNDVSIIEYYNHVMRNQ